MRLIRICDKIGYTILWGYFIILSNEIKERGAYMDETKIEFLGNNSKVTFEEVVSYITMGLQFFPIAVLIFIAVFSSTDLKGDVFENLSTITCIDAATAVTSVYYKKCSNSLLLILANIGFFAFGLLFYIMLVSGTTTRRFGAFYLIIAILTVVYIFYKVKYIIRG
jgi:hypothetical protein